VKWSGVRVAAWVLSCALVVVAVTSCGQTKREVESDELEPTDADPAALCAAEGEDCRREALIANDLESCCEGLTCLSNADGGRTCRTGETSEFAPIIECTAALEEGSKGLRLVSGSLQTSVGTFEFVRLDNFLLTYGESDCLGELSVTLGAGDDCSLTLTATANEGRFIVDGFSASFGGCAGYTGRDPDGRFEIAGETPFALYVEGVICDGSVSSEPPCFGGDFGFSLSGEVPGSETLSFDEQWILLTGSVCSPRFSEECRVP
jgi:hypothetical protein